MVQSVSAAREPFVDIAFEASRSMLLIVFLNSGGTAARNIQFTVLQDCQEIMEPGRKTRGISALPPIANGISYLPAGQQLKYMAGICDAPFPSGATGLLTIDVTYFNDAKREFKRSVQYDLGQFNSVLFVTFQDSLASIAEAIREVRR